MKPSKKPLSSQKTGQKAPNKAPDKKQDKKPPVSVPTTKPAPLADPKPIPAQNRQAGLLDKREITGNLHDPAEKKVGIDPTKPVGFKNPPAATRFQAGKVYNPKGYPKGRPNGSTVLKYWLSQRETITDPTTGKPTRVTVQDTVTLQLIQQARKGNIQAIKEINDRTEGKAVQAHKLLNAEDKAIEITVGFKAPVNNQPAPAATKTKESKK